MTGGPDWSRLEEAVNRAAARLKELSAENRELRAEIARLRTELDGARQAASWSGSDRTEHVRRALERLEGELEALL